METKTIDRTKLDAFTTAYIECALWSSTDDDGEPLDANYDLRDISEEALVKIVADCERFQREHAADITTGRIRSLPSYDTIDLAYAGHDFWLTRNRHGAGFWDGDWEEEIGKRLTDAAHAYGECHLYVGDDGLLYLVEG